MKACIMLSTVALYRHVILLSNWCNHFLCIVYARLQVGILARSSKLRFSSHVRKKICMSPIKWDNNPNIERIQKHLEIKKLTMSMCPPHYDNNARTPTIQTSCTNPPLWLHLRTTTKHDSHGIWHVFVFLTELLVLIFQRMYDVFFFWLFF